MNVFIDIETIPGQGRYDEFLQEAIDNFKAPSNLTKTQACADLGLTGDDAKYTSKDDAIAKWIERFSEEKAPEVAEHNWRQTALDGSQGEVISVAWAVEDDVVNSYSRTPKNSESFCLKMIFENISHDLKRRPPIFIAHNAKFDLKFLYRRAVILGIEPPFRLPFRGRHGNDYYCTSEAWCEYGERVSLNNLCKALGIEGKPDDIDGSKVWDFVKAGNVGRVAEYNEYDVEMLRKVYNRLTFKR